MPNLSEHEGERVRIRMTDKIEITTKADLKQFAKAYGKALARGKTLEVLTIDGRDLRVNPYQVLYFEARS